MINKKKLNDYQNWIFNIVISFSYFLVIITALGLSNSAPTYLKQLDYYIHIYISLFLIWRFNPYRKIDSFTDFDRKIAFSSGLFIFTITILDTYLVNLKTKV